MHAVLQTPAGEEPTESPGEVLTALCLPWENSPWTKCATILNTTIQIDGELVLPKSVVTFSHVVIIRDIIFTES